MPEYLTTRELAELLRIKERKVYDLAASGEVPCARVTGKLLFPEAEVRAWLADGRTGTGWAGRATAGRAATDRVTTPGATARPRPNVLLGSHDPLLERSVRDSRCGLATLLDGSLDGLERFAAGEGVACGLHVRDPADGAWNASAVTGRGDVGGAVLVRFATRRRGLVTAPGADLARVEDVAGRRLVPRQEGSGAQSLLRQLLVEAGASDAAASTRGAAWTEPARSETDAVLAVARGDAEVAFGLESVALEYGLRFVPLVDERFDLLIDRRAWFEPPLRALREHWRSDAFARSAAACPGHDVAALGEVVWNA